MVDFPPAQSEPVPSELDSEALAAALSCVVCQHELSFHEASLVCGQGHRFDPAKQGYFNFLVGAGTAFASDTSEMILARERFQNSGAYSPLKNALRPYCENSRAIDAGCGTGYYTEGFGYSSLLSTDISKFALRRAAKNPRSIAFAWDLWKSLPIRSGWADAVLNVFAPHNFGEFARITAPDGVVLVVTPGPEHLEELRADRLMLNQAADKTEQLDAKASAHGLRMAERSRIMHTLELRADQAADLVFMGPAGHHRTREQILAELLPRASEMAAAPPDGFGQREVTASFVLSEYRHC